MSHIHSNVFTNMSHQFPAVQTFYVSSSEKIPTESFSHILQLPYLYSFGFRYPAGIAKEHEIELRNMFITIANVSYNSERELFMQRHGPKRSWVLRENFFAHFEDAGNDERGVTRFSKLIKQYSIDPEKNMSYVDGFYYMYSIVLYIICSLGLV